MSSELDPSSLIKEITSPGDVAAAALGYAAGFAADIFLFPGGVTAGVTAGVWAVGAIGIKKFVESALGLRKSGTRSLKDTARALDTFIKNRLNHQGLEKENEEEFLALRKVVKERTELWEAGLLDDEEFEYDLSRWRRDLLQSTLNKATFIQDKSTTKALK